MKQISFFLFAIATAILIGGCNPNAGMWDDPGAYAVQLALEEYEVTSVSGIQSSEIQTSNEGFWVKIAADTDESLQYEVQFDGGLEAAGVVMEKKVVQGDTLLLIPISEKIIGSNPPKIIDLKIFNKKKTDCHISVQLER